MGEVARHIAAEAKDCDILVLWLAPWIQEWKH